MSVQRSFKSRARFEFDKARTRAFFNDLITRLFSKSNELFQFDEVKSFVNPHGMVYRGIKPIPVNKIVGSESRYQDFDRDFMPVSESSRSRWENIELANLEEKGLPPIYVYKIKIFTL
jgi:hypothetical protein